MLKKLFEMITEKSKPKKFFKGLYCFRLIVVLVPSSMKGLAGQHPLAVKPEHPADDFA